MISWEIDDSIISKLIINGKNIIYPWGVETADSSSFFSLEKSVGLRNRILYEKYFHNDRNYRVAMSTKMKEGKWALSINDSIKDNSVFRCVEATMLEDTFMMDFVLRFRFKKKYIKYIEINGERLFHRNKNIYHQFQSSLVYLKGFSFDLKLTIEDSKVPFKMMSVVYVRDRKDEWVVHFRMLPKIWDKEVIKICTSWAKTKPLPQCISNLLLSSVRIRKSLWYRPERNPYKNRLYRYLINPAAYPMVLLNKNEELKWNVKMEVL